ncbi:MAG: hypothetical protein VKP62_14655 [Candidatus Sericytochromatia bacterium]|nr:hypothetical protein [Candidatus Sericytochromatia bacterium]
MSFSLSQAQIREFAAQQRQTGRLGQMLGLDLPGRDRLFEALYQEFQESLTAALTQARATGEPCSLDGSGISLTEGGDRWWVHPDGRMDRELTPFEGLDTLFAAAAAPPSPGPADAASAESLLKACYQAFWAPSATNWQPSRVLVCPATWLQPYVPDLPAHVPPESLGWLLLLRRDRYESLLGDVLEPFGQAVTAREESLDSGIFAQTLRLAALAQGLSLTEAVLDQAQASALATKLPGLLEGLAHDDGLDEAEGQALAALRQELACGRYLPDAVMAVGTSQGRPEAWQAFPDLVAAHSTQRIASPQRELSEDALRALWREALQSLPPGEREHLELTNFSWRDQVPRRIGEAMHEALYGSPSEATGDVQGSGLLEAMTVRHYMLELEARQPDWLARHLPAGWQTWDETALRQQTRDLPVRVDHLGSHLRERLLRDGKYRVQDGELRDERGRPLGVAMLVRLMKGLASTFGHYFLRFQNTHPQNAVLLAREAPGRASHLTWRSAGKAAASLTWLARARGWTSIVKTGPIDLAGAAILEILRDNPDQRPELEALKASPSGGPWKAALTFQVGLPLAGSDRVEDGTREPHHGLEERRKDRRPPRACFSQHVWVLGAPSASADDAPPGGA